MQVLFSNQFQYMCIVSRLIKNDAIKSTRELGYVIIKHLKKISSTTCAVQCMNKIKIKK